MPVEGSRKGVSLGGEGSRLAEMRIARGRKGK